MFGDFKPICPYCGEEAFYMVEAGNEDAKKQWSCPIDGILNYVVFVEQKPEFEQ